MRRIQAWVCVLWGINLVKGCGVLVHNEVFRRAATIAGLNLDPTVAQPGAFFPDWLVSPDATY